MQKYEEIISEHQTLQEQLADRPERVSVQRVLKLIAKTREVGKVVSDPQEREKLRAILKHWRGFVYEKTGEFPATQLAPLEQVSTSRILLGRLYDGTVGPVVAYQLPPWLVWGVVGALAIALIVILTGGFSIITGAFETPEPTPTPEPPTATPTPVMAMLTIYNDSGRTICYFYTSPVGEEDWGEDLLGDTAAVAPGDSFDFNLLAAAYDLRADDCERETIATVESVEVFDTVNQPISVESAEETTLLTLHNNSNQTICAVYIAESGEAEWGENWLGAGATVASGDSRVFSVPIGVYDLRAETCAEETVDVQRDVDTSGPVKWTIDPLPPTPTPTPPPTPTPSPTPSPTPGPTPTPDLGIIEPGNADLVAAQSELLGHEGPVLQVAFSPDGQYLASSGADGTIRVWAVATRRIVITLEAHRGWAQTVTFHPEGRWLASGGNDRAVRLWDIETGQTFAEFLIEEGFVFDVAFSPFGRMLAASSGGGTVHLWDTESGSELAVLQDGDSAIYDIAFSPDGRLFASAGVDGAVRVLENVPPGSELCWFNTSSALSLAFSPDSRSLVVGEANGDIVPLSLPDNEGETIAREAPTCAASEVISAHVAGVNTLAYNPGGGILASGGDATIKLWRIERSAIAQTGVLEGHQADVRAVAFSPDGRFIASGDQSGVIILWGIPGY
jgi:hypothetical protein